MRKRYYIFAAVLAAVTACPFSVGAFADTAKSACLMNAVTGEILFEKNGNENMPMASTTKIMTLLVSLAKSDADETVTVSHNADWTEGSSAYIDEGGRISMRDLRYGLMLNSGNDAAVAIAEHISGSEEKFAAEMNKLANEIGVVSTHFQNPNGLDNEEHYTTAEDLAKITRYALSNEEFCEIVSARTYTARLLCRDGSVKALEYINHNKLLKEYDGCMGVKTGFTKKCGRCLVSAAQRGGGRYIAVTLNCPNDWAEHKEMLDSAFSTCRSVRAVAAGDCMRHIKSKDDECELIAAEDFFVPLNGDKGRNIEISVNIPQLEASPLNKGEKTGYIDILLDGEKIGTVDIIAGSDFLPQGEIKAKPCFAFEVKNLLKNIL